MPFLSLLAFWWACSGLATFAAFINDATPIFYSWDSDADRAAKTRNAAIVSKARFWAPVSFVCLGSLFCIFGSANA